MVPGHAQQQHLSTRTRALLASSGVDNLRMWPPRPPQIGRLSNKSCRSAPQRPISRRHRLATRASFNRPSLFGYQEDDSCTHRDRSLAHRSPYTMTQIQSRSSNDLAIVCYNITRADSDTSLSVYSSRCSQRSSADTRSRPLVLNFLELDNRTASSGR